ncbi:MAG: ABC transporter permease [Oscillospiraceae bacterium]|nr:ABC transporter permease [Oscillospiraceae bacterium]
MARTKGNQFPSHSFSRRLNSMLRVDARRMFATPLFWVCLGVSFAIPILVLVMTGMVGGAADGLMFTNTWQIIESSGGGMMAAMGGALSGGDAAAAEAEMDMTGMMNINLMYFLIGVFLCLFTAEDFRSGYAKNLFTVRARKTDYVASKTIIGVIAGALFLLAFFLGGVFGGSVAGLSFDLGDAGIRGLVMCMLAKIFLSAVFVSIFLLMSVFAKGRSWMSICLSLFGGMLLFMMIPMLTPLNSGVGNVGMCLVGGAIFAAAIGAVSNAVLKKTSLVG